MYLWVLPSKWFLRYQASNKEGLKKEKPCHLWLSATKHVSCMFNDLLSFQSRLQSGFILPIWLPLIRNGLFASLFDSFLCPRILLHSPGPVKFFLFSIPIAPYSYCCLTSHLKLRWLVYMAYTSHGTGFLKEKRRRQCGAAVPET